MTCPYCDSQVPDGTVFCEKCGMPLPQADSLPPTPPTPVFYAEPESPSATLASAVHRHRRRKWPIILTAVILAAALILGGILLWNHLDQSGKPDKKSDAPSSKPVHTQPSKPDVPDEPVDPDDQIPQTLTVTQAELTFELTQQDVDDFYDLLARSEEFTLTSDDQQAVEAINEELDEAYLYLESQHSIAMILYYCDLSDKDASQLYLDTTETVTQANNDYLEMVRRIYQSDAPCKDILFEDWTQEELDMLLKHTEEVTQLQQRNSEIEVAYQDLQNTDELYEEMVPLYVEMVANNNRIAQIYGYDNYYTYAYSMVYNRDYAPEQIETMRTYVADYIAPSLSNAMDRFMTGMEELGMGDQYRLATLMTEPYTANYENFVENYIFSLPKEQRQTMCSMFDGNILMFDDSKDAMEGAFTANVTEDQMVCFFGPGYSTALTVIHEVGHYYGGTNTFLQDIPLDLAETQSQGNEWLFIAWLKDSLSEELYQSVVDYKMYSDMATITVCMLVDAFEQQVYAHPDPASLTGDDLDAIMEEVCQRYGGTAYIESVATDIQSYWRMVVVEQPVYYISYGVSAVAAINLFTTAQSDYEGAQAAYRNLCGELEAEDGFLSTITDADLAGPFAEEVYQALQDMYN